MTNEIAGRQKCIVIRGDIRIWVDHEKASKVILDLNNDNLGRFRQIEGRVVNVADIVGIFNPIDLTSKERRRRGDWQDGLGVWRNKGDYECARCGAIVPAGKICDCSVPTLDEWRPPESS